MFCKKGALRNFAKSTAKHLYQSLFLNKVASLSLQFYWKSLWHSGTGIFLWILRNFWEHLFSQNISGGCFYFVTKKPQNSIPCRKLSLNWKKHSKTTKEYVLIKHALLIRFFQISILQGYGRTLLLRQRRSEAAVCRCFTKQMFLKIAKFTGKQLCWSGLNKVASLKRLHRKCFSMIFVKLLRTPYNETHYTIKIAYD